MPPSALPTLVPTSLPTLIPTLSPTFVPTLIPTPAPSTVPTFIPTPLPTQIPTSAPTSLPTLIPTPLPTLVPTPIPQPGVIVTLPPVYPLVVSENGTRISSFTIELTTAPLSRVWVNFSSRFGHASTRPQSVQFDYTDFRDPVEVTVLAAHDWIQELHPHHDAIVAAVHSNDSWAECEAAPVDRVCPQAVSYDKFGDVPAVNVTVLDDDFAGVAVSATEVFATFDNYGDPLQLATYNLTLTSQPTEPVTVTVTSTSPYSVILPSPTFLFTPERWRTPQSVYVSAAAPTSERPVCGVGGRYCALLGEADEDPVQTAELIRHAVSSIDEFYAVLKPDDLPTVTAQVAVERDSTDPPKVAEAKFGDLLNSITITFDKYTNRAELFGSFPCSDLLVLTSAEEDDLFGAGSACSFLEQDELKVTFGEDPNVEPNSRLPYLFTLRDGIVQAVDDVVSLFSTNATFRVQGPDVAVVPEAILTTSTHDVGLCDDLIVDGSTSTGSGGRAVRGSTFVVV